MRSQYFCYVYDVPEGTPVMFPMEADTLPDAVSEARRAMDGDRTHSRFAEIWDGGKGGAVIRVEGPKAPSARPGLLRSLKRDRIF